MPTPPNETIELRAQQVDRTPASTQTTEAHDGERRRIG